MYDIYFDLNNMHQLVDTPADELSQIYDELVAVSEAQAKRDEEFWAIGENISFDFIDAASIDEDEDDDFAVIVTKPSKDGLTCKHCGEMYPYAEPNLKGGGFKCWSCRNS